MTSKNKTRKPQAQRWSCSFSSLVTRHSSLALPLLLTLLGTTLLWPQNSQQNVQEQLAIHRNLGKAFYENPTTQQQAVDEFSKALQLVPDSVRERVNYGLALLRAGQTEQGIAELQRAQQQDPSVPHTWFNLGIAYKKAGENDKAIAEFQKMIALVPDEPVSHYNLGYLYRLTDQNDLAVKEFETAERLNPGLGGPHFQLYNAYRAAGRTADADRELRLFQQIRQQQQGAAIPEDLDWSMYAEVYDVAPETPAGVAAPATLRFDDRQLGNDFDSKTAGLTVLDYNGDGRPDLLAWSANGIRLYRNGATAVSDTGLESLRGVRFVAPGDFNNDGLPDLCVITDSGAALYVNQNGHFEKSPFQLPAGAFRKAIWLDYDHDYDLDLILLGDKSALARNNGGAGFSDMTQDFPFASGKALDATVMDLDANGIGLDLVVSYADRPAIIYRDKLGGKFEAQPLDSLPAGAVHLTARDWNNDGWTDLAARYEQSTLTSASNLTVLLLNRNGSFTGDPALTLPVPASGSIAFADLEGRGQLDWIAGQTIFRDPTHAQPGPWAQASSSSAPIAYVVADFDRDGLPDIASILQDGSSHIFRNATPSKNNWVSVALVGVRNLKTALGARVEVKAGSLYLKQIYDGVPLLFGLGPHAQIDAVRITWPNGLIQNEINQPVDKQLSIHEAQRLSGSCPMIFSWDGHSFQFVTDTLGIAPLGASLGDGKYFPVDHQDFIQVPAGALVQRDNHYEIRITEELREVSYLDQVQLMAVDHPADVEIFTNEKFKGPPFPEFRLFGVHRRIYPKRATDSEGNNVLPQLLRIDGRYPDAFPRDLKGVAKLHYLDLDFGNAAPANKAILVLNGWVDWADGSTFRAAAQESEQGLVMPYLQVKNAKGEWQTVVDDMGMPAGKPKTIVVDLTGKFLSSSRQVRIVTSIALYWDEIFLSEGSDASQAVVTPLPADSADLHFRGFSQPVIDAQRTQPEQFNYQQWLPVTMGNPTPGLYTRYGDVLPLIRDVDERLVIMGSGDELRLLFPADALPPLQSGWKRDFLVKVDGWAKDQDANTAFGQSVEPLPFHAMSAYPYPATEHYPDDAVHNEYRAEYNTRPALRLMRPLIEDAVPMTRTQDANVTALRDAQTGVKP